MTNVLLTSTGRRGYLVGYFREALAGRGRVLAANSSAHAPGLSDADASFLLPTAADPSFGDALLRLCREEEVRLLVSLHDWEAPWIAPLRSQLLEAGTIACVPDEQTSRICLDKLETATWANRNGIRTPRTTQNLDEARNWDAPHGWVMKSRFGQGSLGLLTVTNPELLEPAQALVREHLERMSPPPLPGVDDLCEVIVSEFVSGKEFGVDLVNDFDGKPHGQIFKEKLGMRAGETDAAVTRQPSADLGDFGLRVATALAHPGQCDTDVLVTEQGPSLIELNPRFGGHYPFSHLAGANVPKFLVGLALDGAPDPALLQVRPDSGFMKTIGFSEIYA